MDFAQRIKKLPPYLFVEVDRAKQEAIADGKDVIDLGVGDPDIPTPDFIISAMNKALKDNNNHCYPSGRGKISFREAIAEFYKQQYKVNINVDKEIIPLLGSKEGIAHAPLAFINEGDCVLVPNPGYPPYQSGTILAGGVPFYMPLKEENNFIPVISDIPEDVLTTAKLMFINYPNNPTAAVAKEDFYKEVVRIAKKYDIIVCSDAAYSQIYYDKKPLSFLQIPGAKEVGVEFGSFSKTYCMTGWRIGWVCGSAGIIDGLAKVKSNIDSGLFRALQDVAVVALEQGEEFVQNLRDRFKKRRDIVVEGLNRIGWDVRIPEATFYIWVRVPTDDDAITFSKRLLQHASIVATPGVGMGTEGEGFIRFSLTRTEDRLQEAVSRLEKLSL